MSALHADVTGVLRAWSPEQPEQEVLRRDYLAFLAEHPDGVFRSCRVGHVTASALVMNYGRSHVLLTLHPKVGRWLQMGGHVESDDESLRHAAWREAWEESGIAGGQMSREPVQLDRHPVPCGHDGMSEHLDVQYAIAVPDGSLEAMSHESLDLRWFPIHRLPEDTDDSVRALVAASRRMQLAPWP